MIDRQKLANAKDWAEGQRKGAPNWCGLTLLDALTELEEERDRLREGHRLIKGFATHIMDNPVNPNLVWTRANNIVRWIENNAALQNTETEGSDD